MSETPGERRSWWRRNRAVVQGLGGTAAMMLLALLAYWAWDTNEEQEQQGEDVHIIQSNAPCLPTRENPEAPRDPKACRASFAIAVEQLTPAQSCYIIEQGSDLLRIRGQRIAAPLECVEGLGTKAHPRNPDASGSPPEGDASPPGSPAPESTPEAQSAPETGSRAPPGGQGGPGGQDGTQAPEPGRTRPRPDSNPPTSTPSPQPQPAEPGNPAPPGPAGPQGPQGPPSAPPPQAKGPVERIVEPVLDTACRVNVAGVRICAPR